ncbi:MAG: PEP-CTERM sorting domain-containing protein [Terracidiphilus sp.]
MAARLMYLSILCLLISGATIFAKADTIGPGPSCGSCLGSSYSLTYSTTANPNTFDIYLTIDTAGFTNSSSDLLNAVSLKLVSKTSDVTSVSLIAEPPTFGTTESGGLNAKGCDGNGGGFFCSASTGNGLAVGSAGDVYTFEWQLTLGSETDLMTGVNADSVKALYVTSKGKQNGITSEDIGLTENAPGVSPVPEPSSLLLLGSGLLVLAGAVRKKLPV